MSLLWSQIKLGILDYCMSILVLLNVLSPDEKKEAKRAERMPAQPDCSQRRGGGTPLVTRLSRNCVWYTETMYSVR